MSADLPPTPVPVVPVMDYGTATKLPRPWGKGFLALSGTLLHPGIGHLLAGFRRRALFWFGISLLTEIAGLATIINPRWPPWLLVILPAMILLTLAAYVDAFLCGRRSRKKMLGRAWARYTAGLALVVATIFLNPFSFSSRSLAYYVRDRYVQSFQYTSSGMAPTLQPGDFILVHKNTPWTRWDAVVLEHPQLAGTKIVSRVIGLPGETVEIVNGQVRVNGALLSPPSGVGPYVNYPFLGSHDDRLHGKRGSGCTGNPICLGEGEYYLLSDNSRSALDSRLWEVAVQGHQLGAATANEIVGKVTFIYWPPSRWRSGP